MNDRIVSGVCAVMITVALSGAEVAGGGERDTRKAERPTADAVPKMDPPFIISMWCGPSRKHITVEDYQRVADCGFNVVLPPCEGGWGCDVTTNRSILDICKQVGLKAVIADSRLVDARGRVKFKPGDPELAAAVDAMVADYADHPALGAYYVEDEPGMHRFEALAEVFQRFREKDARHFPYINLSPWNNGGLRRVYVRYVDTFIESVKPTLVSWDNYEPLLDSYADTNGAYFANLEVIRSASLRAGLPYLQIILANRCATYREPTEAELRWQIYMTISYGAHGIMYFTYWPVVGPGIVDKYGKPGPKYPIIRALNARVNALAPTLVRLKSAGVYHTEPLPTRTSKLAEDAPVKKTEGGQMVLGWLKDDRGADYLFVVNRDRNEKLKARLTLEDTVRTVEEISQSTGKPQASGFAADTHLLVTDLEAGEGRLFQLGK